MSKFQMEKLEERIVPGAMYCGCGGGSGKGHSGKGKGHSGKGKGHSGKGKGRSGKGKGGKGCR